LTSCMYEVKDKS